MFLSASTWTTWRGQHTKGRFLILFKADPDGVFAKDKDGPELRALIRLTQLDQFGPWMMGRVTVITPAPEHKAIDVRLSGAYGHDGLPLTASDQLWPWLRPLPSHVQAAFWAGEGGHNGPGSEGPDLRQWAKLNSVLFRKLRKRAEAATELEILKKRIKPAGAIV